MRSWGTRHPSVQSYVRYDDKNTCAQCGGPERRSRCLLCGHVSAPKLVVRFDSGAEEELFLRDLLTGRWRR